MKARIEAREKFPKAYRAMFGLEAFARESWKSEPLLIELIKMRVSQINGCCYCIDMHSKDARMQGETEQRLYALSAWRETPFFSQRERAALEWAETVTLVGRAGVSDPVYDLARLAFSEEELVNLTVAVIAINGWNRWAISFGLVPGTYVPATT